MSSQSKRCVHVLVTLAAGAKIKSSINSFRNQYRLAKNYPWQIGLLFIEKLKKTIMKFKTFVRCLCNKDIVESGGRK